MQEQKSSKKTQSCHSTVPPRVLRIHSLICAKPLIELSSCKGAVINFTGQLITFLSNVINCSATQVQTFFLLWF